MLPPSIGAATRRVNGATGLTPQQTSRCVSAKDTVHVILLAPQASRRSGMILGSRLPIHDDLPVYYQ